MPVGDVKQRGRPSDDVRRHRTSAAVDDRNRKVRDAGAGPGDVQQAMSVR